MKISVKEDLVDNGYYLFGEDIISRHQCAEEFINPNGHGRGGGGGGGGITPNVFDRCAQTFMRRKFKLRDF